MHKPQKIYLISPRGFCAGVDRAIETVELALECYGLPLYIKHDIVHNSHVVQYFKDKGVLFTDDISEIPQNARVIFSAHGVSPIVVKDAKHKNLHIIDATCPLVMKVHLEARRYKKNGYQIILIGHENHIETIGTYEESPETSTIIENIEDAQNIQINPKEKIAYLTQTTLSIYDTKEIINILKKRFPNIESPKKQDICYATTNRQEAVQQTLKYIDILLVIGTKTSSNSNRLREIAELYKKPAYLINSYLELNLDWFDAKIKSIGITSGASTPENLVQDLLQYIQKIFSIKNENIKEIQNERKENIIFKLPSMQKVIV